MSLPGNYAPRPSGYGNWVGTQAARAVAAYVLDNGHHLIAPYLGTTETARNIPPISYMDKIRMSGGPTHMQGYPVANDNNRVARAARRSERLVLNRRKAKKGKFKFKRTRNARKRTSRKRT